MHFPSAQHPWSAVLLDAHQKQKSCTNASPQGLIGVGVCPKWSYPSLTHSIFSILHPIHESSSQEIKFHLLNRNSLLTDAEKDTEPISKNKFAYYMEYLAANIKINYLRERGKQQWAVFVSGWLRSFVRAVLTQELLCRAEQRAHNTPLSFSATQNMKHKKTIIASQKCKLINKKGFGDCDWHFTAEVRQSKRSYQRMRTQQNWALQYLLSAIREKDKSLFSGALGRLWKHPSVGCSYAKGTSFGQGTWVSAVSAGGAECGLMFCTQDFWRTPFQCAGTTRKLISYLTALPDIVWITNSYHFLLKEPWVSSPSVPAHTAPRTRLRVWSILLFPPATSPTHHFQLFLAFKAKCSNPAASFSSTFLIFLLLLLHLCSSVTIRRKKD